MVCSRKRGVALCCALGLLAWLALPGCSQDSAGGAPSQVADAGQGDADLGGDPADMGADQADVGDPLLGTFGDPCSENTDCDTGYCVHGGGVQGFCTSLCQGECSREGYTCQSLTDAQGGSVSVCYPEENFNCAPCEGSSQCGDGGGVCLEQADGLHCAQLCEFDERCPVGYTCQGYDVPGNDALKVCVLVDSVCTDCFGVDFRTDPENCGRCGHVCEVANASAACVEGRCQVESCQEGWLDCNEFLEGCETPVGDTCGGGCAELEGVPGQPCGACGSGTWACNGDSAVICAGDQGEEARNACGGCQLLAEVPGEPCGACGSGTWVCDGAEQVVCDGDRGDEVRNACGGCAELPGEPSEVCNLCGEGGLGLPGHRAALVPGGRARQRLRRLHRAGGAARGGLRHLWPGQLHLRRHRPGGLRR